jgi:hypothetical protein
MGATVCGCRVDGAVEVWHKRRTGVVAKISARHELASFVTGITFLQGEGFGGHD